MEASGIGETLYCSRETLENFTLDRSRSVNITSFNGDDIRTPQPEKAII
jgi:hypothetical protein